MKQVQLSEISGLIGGGLTHTVLVLAENPQLIPCVSRIACNFNILSTYRGPGSQASSWHETICVRRECGTWPIDLVTDALIAELQQRIELIVVQPWMPPPSQQQQNEITLFCESKKPHQLYRYFSLQKDGGLYELERFKEVTPFWEDNKPQPPPVRQPSNKLNTGRMRRGMRRLV